MPFKEEKQIHVRLPVDVYKALRIRCVNEDKSVQDFVTEVLSKELERSGNNSTRKAVAARHA